MFVCLFVCIGLYVCLCVLDTTGCLRLLSKTIYSLFLFDLFLSSCFYPLFFVTLLQIYLQQVCEQWEKSTLPRLFEALLFVGVYHVLYEVFFCSFVDSKVVLCVVDCHFFRPTQQTNLGVLA